MGLLLSVLITCVGVLEVVACYTHFQLGITYSHCKNDITDIARNYALELRKNHLHHLFPDGQPEHEYAKKIREIRSRSQSTTGSNVAIDKPNCSKHTQNDVSTYDDISEINDMNLKNEFDIDQDIIEQIEIDEEPAYKINTITEQRNKIIASLVDDLELERQMTIGQVYAEELQQVEEVCKRKTTYDTTNEGQKKTLDEIIFDGSLKDKEHKIEQIEGLVEKMAIEKNIIKDKNAYTKEEIYNKDEIVSDSSLKTVHVQMPSTDTRRSFSVSTKLDIEEEQLEIKKKFTETNQILDIPSKVVEHITEISIQNADILSEIEEVNVKAVSVEEIDKILESDVVPTLRFENKSVVSATPSEMVSASTETNIEIKQSLNDISISIDKFLNGHAKTIRKSTEEMSYHEINDEMEQQEKLISENSTNKNILINSNEISLQVCRKELENEKNHPEENILECDEKLSEVGIDVIKKNKSRKLINLETEESTENNVLPKSEHIQEILTQEKKLPKEQIDISNSIIISSNTDEKEIQMQDFEKSTLVNSNFEETKRLEEIYEIQMFSSSKHSILDESNNIDDKITYIIQSKEKLHETINDIEILKYIILDESESILDKLSYVGIQRKNKLELKQLPYKEKTLEDPQAVSRPDISFETDICVAPEIIQSYSDLETEQLLSLHPDNSQSTQRVPSPYPMSLFGISTDNGLSDLVVNEDFLRSLDGVKPNRCDDRRRSFKKKRNSSSSSRASRDRSSSSVEDVTEKRTLDIKEETVLESPTDETRSFVEEERKEDEQDESTLSETSQGSVLDKKQIFRTASVNSFEEATKSQNEILNKELHDKNENETNETRPLPSTEAFWVNE